MPTRLAGILSLIAFAVCAMIGAFQADNPFTTTIERALVAMAGTFVVALVVGAMGRKMIEENLRTEKKAVENSSSELADPADH